MFPSFFSNAFLALTLVTTTCTNAQGFAGEALQDTAASTQKFMILLQEDLQASELPHCIDRIELHTHSLNILVPNLILEADLDQAQYGLLKNETCIATIEKEGTVGAQ